MEIINNQHSYINIFFRGFPIYIPIFFMILYTFTLYKHFLYSSIGISIIGLIVYIIKDYFIYFLNEILYENTNIIDFPYIGRLTRPFGAINAEFFYKGEDNYSDSLGMPSGHSMTAAFLSIYYYLYLNDTYKYTKRQKNILYNSLLLITIYTMYSRVYIFKVHTIQQTIIGAYLGYLFGIYFYKLSKIV